MLRILTEISWNQCTLLYLIYENLITEPYFPFTFLALISVYIFLHFTSLFKLEPLSQSAYLYK